MKKVLMLAMALTLCAGGAFADHIGLYTDQTGLVGNCTSTPAAGAPYAVYVVHKLNVGGTKGSRFKVTGLNPAPAGTFYTGYSMLNGFININGPDIGISCAYGFCDGAQDFGVLALNFFVTGAIPACAELSIVPDPAEPSGTVVVADCQDVVHAATGGTFFFSANGTCAGCGEPNAVEQSTWGKVKSLYR
jgi:hypothetical protein